MGLMQFVQILFQHFSLIDGLIIIVFFVNVVFFYLPSRDNANILYKHFNTTDCVSSLQDEQRKAIQQKTIQKETLLTDKDLLSKREEMNRYYFGFSIITTIFPLLGMFGTVISLIGMMGANQEMETTLFFGALTSTFWGILSAIVCKLMDTCISYKIEDNEKRIEYLMNPKREYNEKE